MRWSDRALIAVLTGTAVTALFLLQVVSQPYHRLATWDGAVQFSQSRAWDDVEVLALGFPRRWSGGPDRKASADWLAERLAVIGLDVHRDTFSAFVGDTHPTTLENVWGVSRGTERPQEVIVALGNYDMAPTSFQAASDTAAHVGTLLELARVIHASPHRRTFIFLFPDGEEWGMLGARRFATTYPDRHRIVAALSIEDLDPGGFRALGIDGIGQFRGFAPMWLRALTAGAALREGFPTEEVTPLFEWLQRSVLISRTDQGPFLGVGIPAIDLAGRGDNPALKNRIYHRPDDTVDKMQPASIGAYGRIQERILRSIDNVLDAPRESDFYLRTGHDRIISGPWLLLAQAAVFFPLLAAVVIRVRRAHLLPGGLRGEAMKTGRILVVLLAGVLAAKATPLLGFVPRYELYPATARHPLLTDVHWVAVTFTLAVMVIVAWGMRRWGQRRRPDQVTSPAAAMAASLLWLLLVAAVAFYDNPFGAVTFLLLPSMMWLWLEPAQSAVGRMADVLLIGWGFMAVIALFAQYAALLEIGAYILWYVYLGLAYGLFPSLRVVLSFATLAIAWRLVQVTAFSPRG